MSAERSIAIVQSFWRLMASNDFDQVAAILSDDFVWSGRNRRSASAAPHASRR
jgi:hypothetical protein